MFIAHLPAGYILASFGKLRASDRYNSTVFRMLLIGSILPDVDMLYFYLFDGRQTNHHLYWTHLPVFWLTIYLLISIPILIIRHKHWLIAISSLMAGVFLHLVLDTPLGGIAWLYPLSGNLMYLVEVPATQSWWVWNFVLHWTFMIEITICSIAAGIYLLRRNIRPHSKTQSVDS